MTEADLLRENAELRAHVVRLRDALKDSSHSQWLVKEILAETPSESLEAIRAEEREAYSKLLEYAEFVSLEHGFYVCDQCGKQHPYCDFDFIAQLRNECGAIRARGDGGDKP